MAERVGEQFGKYRLERLLGHGGFADVYLGKHIYLDSLAAIKILHARVEGDETTGFLREARTVANLQHPHIVRVLDFDVTPQGDPFLVMEYAPNGSLRRRFVRGTRLPLDMIVSYTKQVASALQFAHNQRLIHCDIKPENMLLSSNNEILLSDFGIAVIAHTSRSHNMQEISGTAAYMAPEQLQGKASPASDQYSLGIVVYEWLTGSYPFHGSLTEIVTQHMLVPPRPLREILPTLPVEVEQVISMALAKDPAQRFARVEAFANALAQASLPFITQPSDTATFIIPGSAGAIGGASTQIAAMNGPTLTPSNPNIISNPALPAYPALTPPSNPAIMAGIAPLAAQAGLHTEKVPETAEPARREEDRKQAPLVSRRSLLIGGAGIVALAAGGTLFAFAEKAGVFAPGNKNIVQLTQQPTSHATQPISSPTSQPTTQPTTAPAPTQQPTTPPPPAIQTYYSYPGPSKMYTVAWSHDGSMIAAAGSGSSIEIINASTGAGLLSFSTGASAVYSVSWSPDNRHIVSGQVDGTIQIWDATSGSQVTNWQAHTSNTHVNAVAWSPDGNHIASGGSDKVAKVWDTAGNLVTTYSGHAHYIDSVAWSPGSSSVVSSGGDATAQVWDAGTGNRINLYTGHTAEVVSVSWMPGGNRIASASVDTTVQVWDASTGYRYINYTAHGSTVNTVAWSPDAARIASGDVNSVVRVWNAATGTTLLVYSRHAGQVQSVAWSPDGSKIASASDDSTVKVWKTT